MKKLKIDLQKENAVLLAEINHLNSEDTRVREVLCDLLGSTEYTNNAWSGREKKVLVRSWEGIAFLIGELKADADYAMCIEAREILRRENEELKRKLAPQKDKECGCGCHTPN